VLIFLAVLIQSFLIAETNIGADIVSRYVWRGVDYGNAVAIQPNIEVAIGTITVGAWGSWAISPGPTDASGNESDLYVSTKIGPIGLTINDYYFPAYTGSDELFNVDKHIIEVSSGVDVQSLNIQLSSNIKGDALHSTYLEVSYKALSICIGNGVYTYSKSEKFVPVSIGFTAQRDKYFASYIINPNIETSFIVFGINL